MSFLRQEGSNLAYRQAEIKNKTRTIVAWPSTAGGLIDRKFRLSLQKVARPERFERPTPRFVVGLEGHNLMKTLRKIAQNCECVSRCANFDVWRSNNRESSLDPANNPAN